MVVSIIPKWMLHDESMGNWVNVGKTTISKPPMTGNGKHTTYKTVIWGMVPSGKLTVCYRKLSYKIVR